MKPSRNILVVNLLYDSLYDESGVMCYEYGNMGEIIKETRIYALPFLSQPIALKTEFRYDSWGRVDSIYYPDGERLNYQYDLGGQLQSISNNNNYTYLDNVAYDRFGAKVSQTYGNGLVTDYAYDNTTRRLSHITVTDNGNNPYSDIQYTYDPVGNVTQANSTNPWLPSLSFSETFTYDASDQLVAAVEQGGGYSLAVTYGNWGKVNTYDLTQTDRLQNTSTQNAYTFTYPTDPNSPQESQSMFAPMAQLGGIGGVQAVTAQYTFGINGSLRKKEHLTHNNPVEYFLFNSAANMKAYSYDKTDFAYYGYNASNTRTYKLNFLNANSWVNGQQLPIHPQSIQAMFYPNAYLNFNQNGEYTKHYYNGSERIASRLGNTALSISMEMTDRLQERVGKLETRFQDDIRELVYTNVQVETPPVSVSSLQSTGTATDIFYYHTNHLGSTAFVTDQNQTVTQGFLYAPFGEITTEYNANFGNNVLPKYSFNAKELDEETGMYYYEARYYKPPVFTSRDPMYEKYFWMSPYAYCANNPVKYVDPDGEDIELNFFLGKNKESSAELFKTIINNGLQGQFEVYYTKGEKGAYSLQIRATKNGGDVSKMTTEAKAFYEKISSMINDHNTTAVIDVVYGSSDVHIGHYQENKIDIADVNQFDDMGKGAATKQGKLMHELVEQFGKAKAGFKKGEREGYDGNHKKGIAAENKVNGTIRKKESWNRGKFTTYYTDEKNGVTTTYTYNTKDPILKVIKQ